MLYLNDCEPNIYVAMDFNKKSLTVAEMLLLRGGNCGQGNGTPPDDNPGNSAATPGGGNGNGNGGGGGEGGGDLPPGFSSWPAWMKQEWLQARAAARKS